MLANKKQKGLSVVKKLPVYTVIEDFVLPKKAKRKVKINPYTALSEQHREWVLENAIRLIEHPTIAETAFEQTLITHNIGYEKQVFFRIGGNDYFLDFYLPRQKVAIEIDGSVHRTQKTYDRFRDKEFSKIGIKTVRIRNNEVYKADVLRLIETRYKAKRYRREGCVHLPKTSTTNQ